MAMTALLARARPDRPSRPAPPGAKPPRPRRWGTTLAVAILSMTAASIALASEGPELPWRSPCRYRWVLRVDPRGVERSMSPVRLDLDLAARPEGTRLPVSFDPSTIEVVACDGGGAPAVYDPSRAGYERYLLPWHIRRYHNLSRVTLSFVLPDERQEWIEVFIDTGAAGAEVERRYPGLVGDGDLLRQEYGRRPTGATHFDAFADLDRDGDLDLFRGGVEPTIECLENTGGGLLVERGRLTSGGEVLTLPHNPHNHRSWVVPHFHDLDGDGDADFLPSFMDGPYAMRIAFFENVTPPGGPLAFADRGPLETVSGTPLAGGAQADGWFPSIAFSRRLGPAPKERFDAVVGIHDHAYLYRDLGPDEDGLPRWADAVALRSGGEEITLFNPCFELADADRDGDDDLFAAPQSGQILYFENTGASGAAGVPAFAPAVTIAFDDLYLQRSTHPRVTAADFTGDGRLDLVIDRAWELTDLRHPEGERVHALFLQNAGSATSPRWEPSPSCPLAPHTEGFPICDAARQNVVRAADWNGDGELDLIAGDCDGFLWLFESRGGGRRPLFAPPRKLRAGGRIFSFSGDLGHARPDVCDLDGDGRLDLVVSSGGGHVVLLRGEGTKDRPRLAAPVTLEAMSASGRLAPIDRGTRSHVLVADWNGDGKKDLVFSDQEHPGFWLFANTGSNRAPRFAAPRSLGLEPYTRPNLGSFVDWDGDGKKDLIACEFEHSIRLYRNVASGRPDTEPRFANRRGVTLVRPESIMMISGADAVDFNRDGDLDIITGQGHGGSGLRFYERDWIEDTRRGTRPVARIERFERARPDLLEVVRGYADAMLEHGRDGRGPIESGLLLSALDRATLAPLAVRPAPPGGVRRGDRAGLPWRPLTGANPQLDENLLRVLYLLGEITGEERYRRAADHEIEWFFENAASPATGLLPWGEHLAWGTERDRPISSTTALTHEFARPWVLWDRTYELAPAAAARFARGLWEHQIADHRTGAYDRHAPYDRHGPRDGKDFPRHGGFYIHTWAHAWSHTGDETFLKAIEVVLARFERKRRGPDGVARSTLGPLDVATAARLVPDPLASRLRRFAEEEDRLFLAYLRERFGAPGGVLRFPPTWQAGYASGVAADHAMLALARHAQAPREDWRHVVLAVADAYLDALPGEDVELWPMSLAHVIRAETGAFGFTRAPRYLEAARRFARLAVDLFWQDRPIPRASTRCDHYESITGADSLALALLEVWAAGEGSSVTFPADTIDR